MVCDGLRGGEEEEPDGDVEEREGANDGISVYEAHLVVVESYSDLKR